MKEAAQPQLHATDRGSSFTSSPSSSSSSSCQARRQTQAFICDYKDGPTILILFRLADGPEIRFSKSRLPLPAVRGGAAQVRTFDSRAALSLVALRLWTADRRPLNAGFGRAEDPREEEMNPSSSFTTRNNVARLRCRFLLILCLLPSSLHRPS